MGPTAGIRDLSDRHICQVALCGHNAGRLREWYRVVFGMARGSGRLLTVPPMQTRRIQGIHPNPAATITWLLDQQDYFQLEFFQYHRPRSQLKPADWRPCDIGYNMMGVFVSNFDLTLHRYAAHSDLPVPASLGEAGDRRACVQDPEGNWIEIMERDPLADIEGTEPGVVRPELGAAVRCMRISVPDLARARECYIDAIGLSEVAGHSLRSPAHEALWGLAGAVTETCLLRGRNFLVELVQYQSHDPQPRPPGYQICDQGFMNIAVGFDTPGEFDRAFEHATSHGMTPNGKPIDIGIFRVMYVNSPDGFSVEMLCARKPLWFLSGFSTGEPYVQNEVTIKANPQAVWERVTDHVGIGDWTVFNSRVLRPGPETPDGIGCLRELSAPGLRIIEEVVDWEDGSHYAYRVRSGAPFRWHRGDVFLSEENGATRVRWAIRFESWLPFTSKLTAWLLGWLFRRSLVKLQQQIESTITSER
jgi:catechol 2,3-dioxygenase-like lactoylglutathione lyase family enzyme